MIRLNNSRLYANSALSNYLTQQPYKNDLIVSGAEIDGDNINIFLTGHFASALGVKFSDRVDRVFFDGNEQKLLINKTLLVDTATPVNVLSIFCSRKPGDKESKGSLYHFKVFFKEREATFEDLLKTSNNFNRQVLGDKLFPATKCANTKEEEPKQPNDYLVYWK